VIAQLRGQVINVALPNVTILIGGFGLEVIVPLRLASTLKIGEEATLFTNLVVREDSLTLYGFARSEEVALFKLLQTVSGIGPKVALSAISVYEAVDIYRALANSDEKFLEKIPGLGKKGVQRLILELSTKAAAALLTDQNEKMNLPNSEGDDENIIAGIVGLGFNAKVASSALAAVRAGGVEMDLASTIKAVLVYLAK
jgi:holliday junction DNA helicase RuvA